MTGPKSIRTGASFCDSAEMNFCSAFEGMTGSGPLGAGASPTPTGSGGSGRFPPNLRRSEMDTVQGFKRFNRFKRFRFPEPLNALNPLNPLNPAELPRPHAGRRRLLLG